MTLYTYISICTQTADLNHLEGTEGTRNIFALIINVLIICISKDSTKDKGPRFIFNLNI